MIPASSDDSALAVEENDWFSTESTKNNYYQYQVNQQGRIFIEENISVTQI